MGTAEISRSTNEMKVDPFYCLEIDREHLVKETLQKVKSAEPKDIRKRLRVSFKGEEGLDAGGVTKEVRKERATHALNTPLLISSLRIINPLYSLFSFSNFLAKNCLMCTLACGEYQFVNLRRCLD